MSQQQVKSPPAHLPYFRIEARTWMSHRYPSENPSAQVLTDTYVTQCDQFTTHYHHYQMTARTFRTCRHITKFIRIIIIIYTHDVNIKWCASFVHCCIAITYLILYICCILFIFQTAYQKWKDTCNKFKYLM